MSKSITQILEEGILGKITGCRVNGGGINRCMIHTYENVYIIGRDEVITRDNGKWIKYPLVEANDLKFCKELESKGYDFYYSPEFNIRIHGLGMDQIHLPL